MGNSSFKTGITKPPKPDDILTDEFIKTKLGTLDNNKSYHIHTCWTTANKWKDKLHTELQNCFTKLVGKYEADCIIALSDDTCGRIASCCQSIIDNLQQDGIQLEKNNYNSMP